MAVVALVAAASLTWPFGWDQGIFASVGGVIAGGGVPYRDAWDIKGPLTHFVYAFAHGLFGPVSWGIRIVDLVLTTLVTCGLAHVAAGLGLRDCTRCICLAFVLWYASGTYWHTAQPDAWAGGLIVAEVALLAGTGFLASWRYAGAGALVGLAALVKPHYFIFLVIPAVAAWHGRRVPQALAAAAAGFVAVVGAATTWLASHGALDDFAYAYIEWPLRVYSSADRLPLATAVAQLSRNLFPFNTLLAVIPVATIGAAALWREPTAGSRVLLAWTGAAVFAVVIQRRFFDYHWTVSMPPLILVATFGLRKLADHAATRPRVRAALTVCGFLFVLRLIAHPTFEVAHLAVSLMGLQSPQDYERHFGVGGIDRQMAHELRARTSPDETVLMFGPNVAVVYLAGRQSPSRFAWNTPLLIGEGTRKFAQFRREYVDALRDKPPRFIVEGTVTGSVVPEYRGHGAFREFAQFLDANYALDQTVEHLTVYRRIAP